MKPEEVKKILDSVKIARNNPYHVQEFLVNGFKLMIHWDSVKKWFECVLHYSAHSSSYYHYSRSGDDLVEQVQETMDSWGGKGNYKLR